MRTLVFERPNEAHLKDRERPEPGPSDVLVRMVTVGICHSDFDLLAGKYVLPLSFPLVPGHEWTGVVVAVGGGVSSFEIGDRVVGECAVAPDEHFGFTYDGALSEYFLVPAAWLHKLPDSIDDTVAALVEPFTVGYGAAREFDGGDVVAVLGAGPIGLCATATAAARRAKTIVVEPDRARRELAVALGADLTVDPAAGDTTQQILELTHGRGADGVVEASGHPAAMADALTMAAYGARITYVGINVGTTQPAALGLIMGKALTIRGQMGSTGVAWPRALRFLERLPVDLSAIVSQRFPLERATDALDAARDRHRNVKVHIHSTI